VGVRGVKPVRAAALCAALVERVTSATPRGVNHAAHANAPSVGTDAVLAVARLGA